jgi:hypothetical protein
VAEAGEEGGGTEGGSVNRAIIRIEWAIKMALGWCCYQWWLYCDLLPMGKIGRWAMSWGGFYAFDTGFDDYFCRRIDA